MGNTYPLDYPLVKNSHLERGILLNYALPLRVFGITMGSYTNDFGGKLPPYSEVSNGIKSKLS